MLKKCLGLFLGLFCCGFIWGEVKITVKNDSFEDLVFVVFSYKHPARGQITDPNRPMEKSISSKTQEAFDVAFASDLSYFLCIYKKQEYENYRFKLAPSDSFFPYIGRGVPRVWQKEIIDKEIKSLSVKVESVCTLKVKVEEGKL